MLRYAVRRVPSALVVLLVASVIVFIVPRLAEGDAADVLAGPDASQATRDAVRSDLGLDRSPVVQYLHLAARPAHRGPGHLLHPQAAGARGHRCRARPDRHPDRGCAAGRAGAGRLAGIVMGAGRNRVLTRSVSALVSLAFAVPPYVSGVLLVLLFAVTVRLLPSSGYQAIYDDPVIARAVHRSCPRSASGCRPPR